ncbi:MAG: tetratricopeptide repeat protein [Bacteroidota bacterium]|nr:tetratricopeptide repeat protein [Bacteroidota bacterium]
MKILKYILSFLFVIFLFNLAKAQKKIDSLSHILEQLAQDEQQSVYAAELLIELYEETKTSNQFFSLQYVARALEIYTLKDDTVNIALMYTYIGDNYYERGIYNMAMDSYTKSYDLYSMAGAEKDEAYTKLKIGKVFLIQNLDSNASGRFFEALEIFKSLNSKKGVSFAYENIADVKLREYSQETAMKYLDSALLLRRSIRDDELIALSYENIANAHLFNENFSEAESYLEMALDKYRVTNNKVKVADIYFSLGERFVLDEKYPKAKQNFEKALAIYSKYNISSKEAETYNKKGFIAYKTNHGESAKRFAEQSLKISLQRELPKIEKNSYSLLSQAYEREGSYKKALEFLSKYRKLNSRLIEDERRKQSTELQVNLATQKKEQEIKLLKKDRQLQDIKLKKNEAEQKTLYYGFALSILILLFAAFFGYYFYKTNKNTRVANNLLVDKNKRILEQKAEIEIKSTKITASLNYAGRIQRAMFPKIKEIKKDIPESFVILSPKEAVSGDFIWYGKTKDKNGNEKYIISAVDCTGHGIPGAFMSMIGDSYLNQIIYQQNILEPDEILKELHKGINRALKQGTTNNMDGMDMSLCVIDPKEHTVAYSGAKNPLVYLRNGEMKVIKGDSNSIGGFTKGREKKFTKHLLTVNETTQFFIYSDGFQDQFGGEGNKKYMARKFREFLKKISELPTEKQAVALAVELDEWKGNNDQMDDVLVIGFKLKGK